MRFSENSARSLWLAGESGSEIQSIRVVPERSCSLPGRVQVMGWGT